MFSDQDIIRAIDSKWLTIEPFHRRMVQPASIDVRLSDTFRTFSSHKYEAIDPAVEQEKLTEEHIVEKDHYFVLHPGQFVLASTFEVITLDNHIACQFNGKSSLGRLGLVVHSTAGFIDSFFSGTITLELSNVANLPIKLYPGMKIGQICVFRLDSVSLIPYGSSVLQSHYQGQRGPTPSKSWQNFSTNVEN